MKRIIILTIVTLLLSTGTIAAPPSEQNSKKAKSKIERFLQKLPNSETAGINYTYISANMIKSIYSIFANNDDTPFGPFAETLKSIRYVKKFETTTHSGYFTLKNKVAPLLAGDDEIMGINPLIINSENKKTSIIYSNKENTLIIKHNSDKKELTLTFIAGISLEELTSLTENGFDFNF